jgi:oligosaccharide repeat unit polymerase
VSDTDLLLAGVFATTGLTLLVLSRKVFGHWMAPLGLHGLFWYGPLAAFALRLVEYRTMSFAGWSVIIGTSVVFTAACLTPLAARRSARGTGLRYTFSGHRAWIALLMLWSAATTVGVIQVLVAWRRHDLNVLTYFASVYLLPQGTYLSGIGMIHQLGGLVPMLAVLLWTRFRSHRMLLTGIGGSALLMTMIDGNKLPFVLSATLAALCYLYFNRLRVLPLIAWCIGIPAFVGLSLFLKAPGFRGDHRNWVRDGVIALPTSLAFLGAPYVYVTSSFPALDAYMGDASVQPEMGQNLLRPVFVLAGKFDPGWSPPEVHGEFYDVPIPANTYTYLRRAYQDFGMLGVVAYPFMLAIGLTTLFLLARSERRGWLLLPYFVLAWGIVISFFSDHFVSPRTWLLVLGAAVLARAMRLRLEHGTASQRLMPTEAALGSE